MWNVTQKIQDCTRLLIQRNREKEIEKEINSGQRNSRQKKEIELISKES